MLPTVLDDGSIKLVEDMKYDLCKIARKVEQHVNNPEPVHVQMKALPWYSLVIGKTFRFGGLTTSKIKSVYIHGLKEFDELFYPLLGIVASLDDLPEAKDLVVPSLLEGDMILATDNSIYSLRPIVELNMLRPTMSNMPE